MVSLIIVILTCLLFSAFFSGMEIAFTSANKLKLEIEKKRSSTFERIVNVFLRDPGQYITTILVGNNIALVIYSLNMTLLLNVIFAGMGFASGGGWHILLETVVSTVVIIFIGEFMPKALVRNNPNFFLRIFAAPLYFIYILLYPIAKFSTWLSVGLLRLFGLKIKPEHNIQGFDRVELEHLVDEAAEYEQEKTDTEIKLFQNAMDFSDLRVRDCMVPRVDIEAIDIHDSVENLAERFVESSYSRIFVYEGSIDNIIGYVTSKSLFTSPERISDVLKQVDFVPESLPAQTVLQGFIKKNRAIAVVIDEFGGTAGIVSMEDVLEEIFGEIEDEHDSHDLVEKVQEEGVYIFSGRLEVDHLNEKYDLGIPESEEYDTLAGYIIYYHEGIPEQGDQLQIDNKEIKVLRVNSSKLDLVKVTVR